MSSNTSSTLPQITSIYQTITKSVPSVLPISETNSSLSFSIKRDEATWNAIKTYWITLGSNNQEVYQDYLDFWSPSKNAPSFDANGV